MMMLHKNLSVWHQQENTIVPKDKYNVLFDIWKIMQNIISTDIQVNMYIYIIYLAEGLWSCNKEDAGFNVWRTLGPGRGCPMKKLGS